jgi:hypothetical protein
LRILHATSLATGSTLAIVVLSPACGGETERGLFAKHSAPSPTLPRKRERGRAEFAAAFSV